MHINIFLILFVVLLGLLMAVDDNLKKRRLYIILCSIVLILVAALRSAEWMTFRYNIDTLNYKNYFETYLEMNWGECWTLAYDRYFGHGGESDIGFIILNKMIGWFTHSFYVYSIIADLIFFIPFGIVLYRYSNSIRQLIFAFVFYIALIQIFLFGGGRQMFAIGFDILAFLAMVDKKRLVSILLFLVGVTIHFSSILFLWPLLLLWFNTGPRTLKWAHVLGFILVPLILAFPNQIIVFMGEASGLEKYTNYGTGEIRGGATVFVLLMEALSLFCLFAIRHSDLKKYSSIRLLYPMLPLITILAPLIRSNGTMIRISLYYHLYLVLLVPYAMDCIFKLDKNKSAAYTAAVVGLAILALQGGGTEYYFFWQK